MRELRDLMASEAQPAEAESKLARHRRSLAMLDRELPGSRLVELLRFELEALDVLPPHGER
ncbi:MAG TPA: hypothetical protein VHJ54_05140 [Solirubrobacterales bacterium]|nr:hypothetical protein [Solirubrobacterales bacterium]